MKINKEDVIIITPVKGYSFEGPRSEGYKVYKPYIEHNFFERLLRELWFRVRFLPNRIWYNKDLLPTTPKYILVSDPLITVDYLEWLHIKFPNAQLNFAYGNMVGKATHLKPHQIPSYYRVWTYDKYDSDKYGIRLSKTSVYYHSFVKPKENAEYDVVYVGADKGRGDFLLQLESKLNEMGMRTKFVIVKDGKFARGKSYYQKRLTYDEITSLIVKSKAILNVALENQQGITVRDMESLFFDVKLLTTNNNIKNTDIYNTNNVYIIEDLSLKCLQQFMSLPHIPLSNEIKDLHTFDKYIEEIVTAP